MKKVITILLVLTMCFTVCACSTGSMGNSATSSNVVINGDAYTLDEFINVAKNNSYKFSNYVGMKAVVTGKITEIQTDWISSNLSHSFDVSITIDDVWVFEVSRSNPMLGQIDVGDVVAVTGTVSAELYGVVYSFGDATIKKTK